VDAERRRLILAACLLHDTSWQAHPDYRAEMCFEAVTRANLGGVDHAGRLFLGLAILSRYKNSGVASLGEGMMALLTDAEINDAVSLGKAMRLGAMISGAQAGLLDKATLAQTGETLVLTLEGPAGALNGEIVEKRLGSLARAMGLEAVLLP
jgi:exopolyphosphatase/guanosine-5'-triphosphate,3'-diphosphate pyrophosphatase